MNRNDLTPILAGLILGDIGGNLVVGVKIQTADYPVLVVAVIYFAWLMVDAVRVLRRSYT